MYWFIRFPNEPDHALHQTMISFKTLVRIIKGDNKSQLSQMSKIHRMMTRYSVKKANRFLNRFPQVYWAPEPNDHTPSLYYMDTNNYKKCMGDDHLILWWALTPKSGVVFKSSDSDQNKLFKVLATGTEFHLYHDPEAGFDERIWLRLKKELPSPDLSNHSEQNKESHRKNNQLRKELGMGYNWRQEAHPHQVRWIKSFLTSSCTRDYYIVSISNTQFEIRLHETAIGMIAIMEYSMYLTLWTDEVTIPQIFGISSEELKSIARKEKMGFYYTNSL